MTEQSLWIVTPVYQDMESFLILRKRILDIIARNKSDLSAQVRFILLDDSAGTDPAVKQLTAADVSIVEPPFNLGHQRGIVFALRRILPELRDTDLVVTLDSDGEDRPEDLLRLLEPLQAPDVPPHRVVLALRTGRRTSMRFKILYFFFRMLFRALTGETVRSGNFAAFRGGTLRRILTHPHFDLCYSSTLLTLNLDITFVPCERGARYAGESRMGYSRLAVHGMRMLMPFIDRITTRALFLFSATLVTGLVASATVICVRVFTDLAIPGWATNTLIGMMSLSFISLASFVTLFAVISQSRAISLANIESLSDGRP